MTRLAYRLAFSVAIMGAASAGELRAQEHEPKVREPGEREERRAMSELHDRSLRRVGGRHFQHHRQLVATAPNLLEAR